MTGWKDVWARRSLDRSRPLLEALMAADGLDTGFGSVGAAPFADFVRRTAARLGLGPGRSVFEVGCGAGGFLWELDRLGCAVGGLDASPALVEIAREVLPRGAFLCAEAAELPEAPQADVVLSFGVFLYFPSLDYAREVLRRMAARARGPVAVLDVPDRARMEAALAARRATLGPEEYAKKYAGLDHLYYERAWMEAELRALGFADVVTEDQSIEGYPNGAFRFNAVARREAAPP